MPRPRQVEPVDFEHYLQVRKKTPIRRSLKAAYGKRLFITVFICLFLLLIHVAAVFLIAALTVPVWAVFWLREPALVPISADEELLVRADQAAEVFRQMNPTGDTLDRIFESTKLKGTIHPAVANLLNECANSWRRIEAINQSRVWKTSDKASHWSTSRQDWTRAAELAMAEALILAESSITYQAPKSRAKEVIGEVIDTLTNTPKRVDQPLPPQFRDIRDIAENLSVLAREVESINDVLRSESEARSQPASSRRLEDVLGQMKAIRTAEEELRQHSGA